MSHNWNTRKLQRTVLGRFYESLNNITSNDTVLVVHTSILKYLNALVPFSELVKKTPVKKIILLDQQVISDVRNVMSSMPEMEFIFLIDLRSQLSLPQLLPRVLRDIKIPFVSILYTTWPTEISNHLTKEKDENNNSKVSGVNLPHLIESQLEFCPDIRLYSWEVYPIPTIDEDVLILDMLFDQDSNDNLFSPTMKSLENASRDILIDNLSNCLEGLININDTIVTNVVTIGREAQILGNVLKDRLDKHTDDKKEFIKEGLYGDKFSSGLETDLIILDRAADPITPLLTQLTYAGIIDDFYNNCTDVHIGSDHYKLDYDTDIFWDEMKFSNFGTIGPKLNQSAKDLQNKYDARHKAESLGEIKSFVDSLASLQERQAQLKTHTTISTKILSEVENNNNIQFNRIIEIEQDILADNLDYQSSFETILDLIYEGDLTFNAITRLLCLLSICKNGLKEKHYSIFKKELIDRFGIEVLFELERLTDIGTFITKTIFTKLKKQSSDNKRNHHGRNSCNDISKEYRNISKWFDTLPINENEPSSLERDGPKDADFAYGGLVPLSTRLIQSLYDRTILSRTYNVQQPFIKSRKPSIVKMEDLISQVFGSNSYIKQEIWVPEPKPSKNAPKSIKRQNDKSTSPDIVLIVFIGGVTIGEIATLKYLKSALKQKAVNKRFIVISDGIINGKRLIEDKGISTDNLNSKPI
ncbi:Vacuolar protein sorting-associated protein 33 [Nakaseomyces bracarensis]|uniref:Vacuolar protein sorting-associated protein 33 n=1 Tax=Nakaseomyces bracarensis TaxID=273131 RepID=A0ABR4NSK1_9SACH